MPDRRRVLPFTVAVLLVVVALAGYLVLRTQQQADARGAAAAAESARPTLDTATVLAGPRLVVRNTAPGPSYGHLALLPLADPDGPRALLDVSCERVTAVAQGGLCLHADTGPLAGYTAQVLGPDLQVTGQTPLSGLPSRARVSADGRYAASTVFVTGHSYADGVFSTETVGYDLRSGRALGNLEKFPVYRGEVRLAAADINVWGVSFVGAGPGFYATVGTGGRTYLVRGDMAAASMTVVRDDGACPSVSPDGRHVVYKARDPESGSAYFTSLDLATGRATRLDEGRLVDDQVAWLDDTTVLYAVGKGVASSTRFDVWAAPIDGGPARLFVPDAASPSVIR